MTQRQYLSCEFKPGSRLYTYHWEGETPLKPGDRVRVDRRDGSEQIVTVAGDWFGTTEIPPFETKPIHGLADLASAAQPPEEN